MKFAHVRACEHFTFAKQIFHSEAISLARRANFVEKTTGQNLSFFLVAGTGLEGRDLRVITSRRLAVPEFSFASACRFGVKIRPLREMRLIVSVPDSIRRISPTSYVRRSHNQTRQANACHGNQTKTAPDGCCFLFGLSFQKRCRRIF